MDEYNLLIDEDNLSDYIDEPDEEYGRNFQCPEYDAWIWWQ